MDIYYSDDPLKSTWFEYSLNVETGEVDEDRIIEHMVMRKYMEIGKEQTQSKEPPLKLNLSRNDNFIIR